MDFSSVKMLPIQFFRKFISLLFLKIASHLISQKILRKGMVMQLFRYLYLSYKEHI